MGAWYGFSALFMQYLESGCGMKYADAAHYILIVPFISLTVVCINIWLSVYYDTVSIALLVCSFACSLFLWISGLYVDKGIGMAIFGILVISISGGFINVAIDSFLTRMNPGMSSIGTAVSMSVKAISCLIFPLVNGILIGNTATPKSISKCCMFMAVPCTIGFILIVIFVLYKPKKEESNFF